MKYPIKISFKTEIFPIIILLAAFAFGIYFYTNFPEQVVTHWNFQGVPDGYSGKFFGALGIPFLLVAMYFLFLLLPLLDPKSERYGEFEKPFNVFKNALLFVMLVIFLATGAYNLGYDVNINRVVPIAIGLLMIVLGNYMGKLKKNWFMGIRTPWTLSSENVWNKTHRVGGWGFVIFGICIIISPFLNAKAGIPLFIAGLLLVTVGSILYSYIVYKKEQRG